MAITLNTIVERLERRLKDISDVSDELWFDAATDLNQLLYRKMFASDPARFITSTTFTVTTSPSTQALPAGFRDVQEYGTGFYVRSNSGADTQEKLPITGFGSIEKGFYIDGTNVVFTGINTSTVIVLLYVPVLADITSLDDTFCVPDENKDLVTEGMVLAYYKNDEDPREGDSDQRFARLLGEFTTKLSKTQKVFSPSYPINMGS